MDSLKDELSALKEQLEDPAFWADTQSAASVNKKIRGIENKINRFEGLGRQYADVSALFELGSEMEDEATVSEADAEADALYSNAADFRLSALMRGPYDANNAILSLHAGAGGTEAQDWVSMLYRMYTRYCERRGFEITVFDYLEGDEAGIKSVTFLVAGDNAYGYMKAEKGVHRLVRISPFDANKRRHTSFASLDVMPEIDDDVDVEIKDDDLRVDTYRSSGAGGQHVNKTSSAIRITHLPTGIVVQCQNERSQIQNRETAMRMLKSKLIEKAEEERLAQMNDIKGEMKRIEWGSQIRSYVFQPYTLVKDHRTGYEAGNITAVMDGDISGFINSYLINC